MWSRRQFLKAVGGGALIWAGRLAGVYLPWVKVRFDNPKRPWKLRERPIGLRGTVHLRLVDPATGQVVKVGVHRNLITDVGLEWLADCWGNLHTAETFRGIQRLALGTDDTPAAVDDVTLGAEHCRVAPYETRQYSNAANAEYWVSFHAFFPAAMANCDIVEIGAFGGADADDDPNSGVLLSRVIVSGYDNSAGNYDVLLDWTFEFARG